MTRKLALGVLRIAGYHEDSKTWTRTYVEHRISYAAAKEQWNLGQQQKRQGMPCGCIQCKQEAAA